MSKRVLVATRKGLFTFVRQGRGGIPWTMESTAFLGDPVTMTLVEPDGDRIHAALDHGHFGVKLHCSTDAGRSWQETTAPSYPEKPPEVDDVDPMRGEPVPWTLKMIWSLEGAHPSRPEVLWCGTLPGGLFRSDDGGTSWNLVEALWHDPRRKEWFGGGADWPGIHTILVDPRNPDHLTIAVSCGGVWSSRDAGTSWTLHGEGMWSAYMPPERSSDPGIQDVHRIAQCAADPDVLWAQHHNGVFRSVDGGKLWEEIDSVPPSNFGFPIAVHPSDPRTAWLVPAHSDEKRFPVDGQVVVSRTRDGGRSFEILRNGLPQEHSYDLVYRHGLDIDESGDCLVLGSTTGSLWITEDQGDSWLEVASHLPPIYCVRFAP